MGGLVMSGSVDTDFNVVLNVDNGVRFMKCSISVDGFSAGLRSFCWLLNRSMSDFRRLSTSVLFCADFSVFAVLSTG